MTITIIRIPDPARAEKSAFPILFLIKFANIFFNIVTVLWNNHIVDKDAP